MAGGWLCRLARSEYLRGLIAGVSFVLVLAPLALLFVYYAVSSECLLRAAKLYANDTGLPVPLRLAVLSWWGVSIDTVALAFAMVVLLVALYELARVSKARPLVVLLYAAVGLTVFEVLHANMATAAWPCIHLLGNKTIEHAVEQLDSYWYQLVAAYVAGLAAQVLTVLIIEPAAEYCARRSQRRASSPTGTQ